MNPNDYLVLSAILFAIGIVGFLTRRNALVAFMSVELMLNLSLIHISEPTRPY